MAELRNPRADRWDLDRGIRELALGPCFPRGITFADLDSETEINGRYLVIEGKRGGEPLRPGQWRACRARVRDGRTVLIIYGDPPYGVRQMAAFTGGPDPVRDGGCVPASLRDVLAFCAAWAAWAQAQPAPPARPSSFRGTAVARHIAARAAQPALLAVTRGARPHPSGAGASTRTAPPACPR